MSAPTEERGRVDRRIARVGLAIVIGAAVAGFLVGTRPTETPSPPPAVPTTEPATTRPGAGAVQPTVQPTVQPAVRYAELAATASVAGDAGAELARLAVAERKPPAQPAPPAVKAAALAARAERRAYGGAPPVVPHAIDQMSARVCLSCHANGMEVEGRIAPKPSHAHYASCTQCHVEGRAAHMPEREAPANRFAALPDPAAGSRAWQGAPPTIPHPTWMRDDCLACHGATGKDGLRTTHPERQSCTQCHALSAVLDQQAAAAEPPPWER